MTVSPATATAIELTDITKTYRSRRTRGRGLCVVTALSRVNLRVRTGEIFGIVGESGSGKTTLGRLMVGLEAPDSGTRRVNGVRIDTLSGRALKKFRSRTQMVFQDPYQSLNPYMSVQTTVGEPLIIHGRARNAHHQQISAMLDTVGLSPSDAYRDSYPHQLSGGQRQRVAIARALVLEPDILVADEPTSMLDASISVQIFQLLAEIQQQRGLTLVFITHSLAAAHYLCDRIAVVYRGHVVEQGPAGELIMAPRHPYTQALIDALPRYGHARGDRRFDTILPEERIGTSDGGCVFFSRCRRADPPECTASKPELLEWTTEHRVACFLA